MRTWFNAGFLASTVRVRPLGEKDFKEIKDRDCCFTRPAPQTTATPTTVPILPSSTMATPNALPVYTPTPFNPYAFQNQQSYYASQQPLMMGYSRHYTASQAVPQTGAQFTASGRMNKRKEDGFLAKYFDFGSWQDEMNKKEQDKERKTKRQRTS
jgi:hypothetical protein